MNGNYVKLGAHFNDGATTFSIFIKAANEVKLNFYSSSKDNVPNKTYLLTKKNKLGNIWSITLDGIKEGDLYNWEVDGKIILDPYALAYTDNQKIEEKKSIVVARKKNETEHILREKKDMLIYELHIGLFSDKKTYSGLKDKIPYLKELGINAVEIMPVFEWDEETKFYNPAGENLKNNWGYNSINFFTLTKKFASNSSADSFDEINEFKNLVAAFHEAGIEVILDVVYNHTAEMGHKGKEWNFKFMGEDVFYLKDKQNEFVNISGCGNTLNCNHKVVKDMIYDSLLYWYLEMGVDGFRFDLASILGRDENVQWIKNSILQELTEDPILSEVKLIAESWDLGGYFVGAMPSGWSEWNGPYRDTVRKFIKGEFNQIPELIKRIFGSVDIFHSNKNSYQSSINFVASHDGFTMWDLLSYNEKHNLNNGEENRDGENQNFSYNHGHEGFDGNEKIIALRKQQMKNILLILYISQGIPMLLMGDEFARTQHGNNNAYCQNDETVQVDWNRKKEFEDIFEFTKNMISLRKTYSIFRKDSRLIEGEEVFLHGVNLHQPDLDYHSLSIAFQLKDKETDTDFYIALNSYTEDLDFHLPKLENKSWYLLTDTFKTETCKFEKIKIEGDVYKVASKSSIILISE